MALLNMNFYAESLWMSTGVSIILPEKRNEGKPYQSLYLLHGGGGDHSIYHRMYAIEKIVGGYNLAVIMPSTPSRYKLKDMEHGEKWLTYVSEELPKILGNMLNLSKDRKDTFAAGFSGGGYNAIKLGLHRPDRFGAIAGGYPALLCQRFVDEMGAKDDAWSSARSAELRHIFGQPIPEDDDGFLMLENAAKKDLKTNMFLCCGTEDGLFNINYDFYKRAAELGFNPTWDQRPGGHTWEFANELLPVMLDWLPLQKL
jgi:S-formylglutathione hydrolase FrmB